MYIVKHDKYNRKISDLLHHTTNYGGIFIKLCKMGFIDNLRKETVSKIRGMIGSNSP